MHQINKKLKDRLQLRVDVWNKYKTSGKIWMFDNDVLNGVDSHLNHNYEYDIKTLTLELHMVMCILVKQNTSMTTVHQIDGTRWQKLKE